MQQALVNIVNYVGVDVNRTLRDSYYASLLPFIGGLGPRKAQGLMKAIRSIVRTSAQSHELLTCAVG
jgi:transcription elongation factor SPT6